VRRRAPSIRQRLAVLILASAVPAVVLGVALLVYEQRLDREALESNTLVTVHAMVNAVDRELAGITAAAEVLATSQRARRGDLAGFYPQAREVVAAGIGTNVVLSDPTGRQVLNTLRPLGERLPLHGNPDQFLAVLASGGPVVSDLYIGGVMRRPVMSVDVPVLREGRVAYVLSVGLLPERFHAILNEQRLPAGWIGVVFDRTGTIVARTQEHDRFVGAKGAPELVARMLQDSEGALDAVTLEGIPVVSVFSRSPVTGWSVALGVPRESVAQPFLRRGRVAAVAVLALVGLGLGFAWAIGGGIARSIRGLARPAAQLGFREAVDVPPLGLLEADEVGKALERASRLIVSAEHRAQHDPLTGLANRALFAEMAAHQVELCKRTGGRLSVLFIDLDGFKQVNDLHGHETGDALLCEVAARLKGALRASDLAARVGGDEFAVLLEGADHGAAAAIAAKLDEVLAAPHAIGGRSLAVPASIGAASCPDSGGSAEELMRLADAAMYRTKMAGKRRRA